MRRPQKPPATDQPLHELLEDPGKYFLTIAIARETEARSYLHWDELRRRYRPDKVSLKELWQGIKNERRSDYIRLPLTSTNGNPCVYCPRDLVQEYCHKMDMKAGGTIETSSPVLTKEHQERFYISSLIDEAATSSILEGATTTQAAAAEMIRANRKPRTNDERMIINNYMAMRQINDIGSQELTPAAVLHLHRTVTRDTMQDSEEEGRLRNADEDVRVRELLTGEIFHTPPAASELQDRMKQMCDFANGKSPDRFIHPVVRSIILHYWLAYDHPFVDGNGRTARALFYWSMLHHGYWLFKFISISKILLEAPSKYSRAFLLSESDEDDLTYFVHYQFKVIQRALDELNTYLSRKTQEIEHVQEILNESERFNYRQHALLSHALRHPGFWYSIQSHRNSHGVAYQTARHDLHHLAEFGFLEKTKRGKTFFFRSPPELTERIKKR